MAKKSAKILIELDVAGHPKVKKILKELQSTIEKVSKGNTKLEASVKKTTAANKQHNKSLIETQRGLRNTNKESKALDAKFSVLRSKLLLVSFGFTILSAAVLRFTKQAGDVEEQQNKFNVLFGTSASVIRKFAEDLEKATGRSALQIMDMASSVQDILVPLGMMRSQAALLSKEIVKTAVDVSSFSNTLQTDVIRDFNSALVGNHETVRKYGVLIDEARIKTFAYEMGLAEVGEEVSNQSKVMARLAIIQADTADTMGDAEKTANSFNNTMVALNTEVLNTSVSIGRALQPVVKVASQAMIVLLKHINPKMWNLVAIAIAGYGAKLLYARYATEAFTKATMKAKIELIALHKITRRVFFALAAFETINIMLKHFYPTVGEAADITKSLNEITTATGQLTKGFVMLTKKELEFEIATWNNTRDAIKSVTVKVDKLGKAMLTYQKTAGVKFMDSLVDLSNRISVLPAEIELADGTVIKMAENLDRIVVKKTSKAVKAFDQFRISLGKWALATETANDDADELFESFVKASKSTVLANVSLKKVRKELAKGSLQGFIYAEELKRIGTNFQEFAAANLAQAVSVLAQLNAEADPKFMESFNKSIVKLGLELLNIRQQSKNINEVTTSFSGLSDEAQMSTFAIKHFGLSFDQLTEEQKEAIEAVLDYNNALNTLNVDKITSKLEFQKKALEATTDWQRVQLEHLARGIVIDEAKAKSIVKITKEIKNLTEAQKKAASFESDRQKLVADATESDKDRLENLLASFQNLEKDAIAALGGQAIVDKIIADLKAKISAAEEALLEEGWANYNKMKKLEKAKADLAVAEASRRASKTKEIYSKEFAEIDKMLSEGIISQARANEMKLELYDADFANLTDTQEKILQATMDSFAQLSNMRAMYLNMRRENLNEEFNAEMDALKGSLEYRRASNKKKEQMEEEAKKKYQKRNVEIFRQEKQLRKANVIMNTADAIMKSWSNWGGAPWALVPAALAGAAGLYQLNMIQNQSPPTMATGGLIGGKLHKHGGTIIEAEKGEFMIRREAAESIGIEQLNLMNRTGESGNTINLTLAGNVLSEDFVVDSVVPILQDRLETTSGSRVTDRKA